MKEKDLLAKATTYAFPDIEEVRLNCVNSTPKKHSFTIMRLAPVAACLAVVLIATIYGNGNRFNTPNSNGVQPPLVASADKGDSQNGNASQPAIDERPALSPTESASLTPDAANTVMPEVNEILAPENAVYNQICLVLDDFVPMTYDQMADYFKVKPNIGDVIPNLQLQTLPPDQGTIGWGIFESGKADPSTNEPRRIYYDANTLLFGNVDGTQLFTITLAKVFYHVYDFNSALQDYDKLKFSLINGREIAIFHYTSVEDKESSHVKNDCYYAEFFQNGVAYYVQSWNLSLKDFTSGLRSLIDAADVNMDPNSSATRHTLIGKINLVDSGKAEITENGVKSTVYDHDGYISVLLDDGQGRNFEAAVYQHRPCSS